MNPASKKITNKIYQLLIHKIYQILFAAAIEVLGYDVYNCLILYEYWFYHILELRKFNDAYDSLLLH